MGTVRSLASTLRSASESMLGSPILVGRDQELQALVALAINPPSVALIEGEAGIGKSRLVSELLASPQLAGHARVVACCHPSLDPFPFGCGYFATTVKWLVRGRFRARSPIQGRAKPRVIEGAGRYPGV